MVESIKDNDGKIVAYCEWVLLDKNGQFKDKGEYIWINDLWIHKDHRRNGMIKKFTELIEPKVPSARYIYWKRHKYEDRMSCYNEQRFLKLRSI